MNDLEVFALMSLGAGLCLFKWRIGVFVCIVAGFLQDPIRKVIPGEPVYMTVSVALFVAATCAGAYLRGVRLRFRPIHTWNKSLRAPMTVFVGLVFIQAMLGYIRTGSPTVAGIGLLAYLSPIPAVLMGYYFARSEDRVIKFLTVYVAVSALMTCGIYLSYAGYDWQLLSSVGVPLITYSPAGDALTLLPGFFRVPEIAAWHAGASVCMLIIFFIAAPTSRKTKILSVALMAFFIGGLVLTGRRKFIVEIGLFIAGYLSLSIIFQRRAIKTAILLFATAAVGFQVYAALVPDEIQSALQPYYQRTAGIGSESAGRLYGNSIDAFQYVIAQNGILGSGAGTGSQGAQYFGGGTQVVGLAAEGGLAKMLAELGIPGLIVFAWLAIGAVRYLWAVTVHISKKDRTLARLTFALTSFLAANALVYTAEHQAFGDVFILVLLGAIFGFLLAIPRIAESAAERRDGRAPSINAASPPLARLEASV